ncbi:MAG TPA: alpha/beta hydrolase, partial [Tepidiformaceae bacterium]|nr:alpha/beta hydrolase [Tepidiformaceae bacterium]
SEQLESGVLVTYRGEGHTIYAQGSECIDDLVDAYLVRLAAPAEGSVCGRGAPPPESGGPALPPATGESGPEESAETFWYWVIGLPLFALAVAFVVVAFVKHRR